MPEEHEKLLDQAREHFKIFYEGWQENRRRMADDLAFIEGDGNQWPRDIAAQRDQDERPCLEINKLPAFVDQVVGDELQNRPVLKVSPVDSFSDPETAEVFNGIIRNIERVSDAHVAYDTAFEAAATCGFGAWRILTQYIDDDSFDQEIIIERIDNQFSLWPDPKAKKIDYSDGRGWFIAEEVPRKIFESMYPKATFENWTEIPEMLQEYWVKEESIRIAEYFYKKAVTSKLYEVTNDAGVSFVLDYEPDLSAGEFEDYEVTRTRTRTINEIWWCKTNGYEILEGPSKWPGRFYPIIPVWGKELNREGKKVYRGIVRHAKDPQRLYNYNRSLHAETTSLAPRVPWLLSAEMVEGHEDMWNLSHKRNFPYLLYNPDPQMPNTRPDRVFPGQLSTAIQGEIVIADQEIHDTTGLQLASLGKASNERSGVAIQERKREGDVGTYGYINSLARAQKYQGKLLVDLIPKIYDTPRVERIIGFDNEPQLVQLNQEFETGRDEQGNPINKIYDLGVGRYDVDITIGPSYTTQRQEAREQIVDMVRAVPEIGQLVFDLIAKYSDWPGADEIEQRLRAMLPPAVVAAETGQPPPPDPAQQIAAAIEEMKLEQEKWQTVQEELKVMLRRLDIQLKEKELREPKSESVAA